MSVWSTGQAFKFWNRFLQLEENLTCVRSCTCEELHVVVALGLPELGGGIPKGQMMTDPPTVIIP